MKIVLDENVSLSLATVLREDGHDVLAVAESAEKSSEDEEVWRQLWPLVCQEDKVSLSVGVRGYVSPRVPIQARASSTIDQDVEEL